MHIFKGNVDLRTILERTRTHGYIFVPDAIEASLLQALAREVAGLALEVGDHVAYPLNKHSAQEVRQLHARAYRPLGHDDVSAANDLCRELAELARRESTYPELTEWMPTEIGYQHYRDARDWISPHRDRRSDRLLSVTFTIAGSAWVRIHESEVDPPDYSRLRTVDAFLTAPGTAMFLRAPGFGSGRQIIHEVLPPTNGSRTILNLRMRPTILKPPGAP